VSAPTTTFPTGASASRRAGEVDGVADHAVLAMAARAADEAGEDLAAVDRGAETWPVGVGRRHLGRPGLELERRSRRPRGMVRLVAALVEDDHHRVPDDLVDDAAMLLQQRHQPSEVAVQHRGDARRLRLLRE